MAAAAVHSHVFGVDEVEGGRLDRLDQVVLQVDAAVSACDVIKRPRFDSGDPIVAEVAVRQGNNVRTIVYTNVSHKRVDLMHLSNMHWL